MSEFRPEDQLQDNLRVFVAPVEILEVEGLSIYEKMAYLVIRSHCNARESSAWPSYATIAKEGSMSRRKAIDAVAELERLGLIVKNDGSSSPRRSVSKHGKIRNDSNLYELERPATLMAAGRLKSTRVPRKKTEGGAHGALGVVHDMHQGGAHGAPEYNHLKDPSLKSGKIDRAAAAASPPPDLADEIINDENHTEVYNALLDHAPGNVYIADNLPAPESVIQQLFTMIVSRFPQQLSADVVELACAGYFQAACAAGPGHTVMMRGEIREPVGLFHRCYAEAIKLHKARRYRNGK